ncbi:putative sodium-coupled neutral amino acid transporter 6 [Acipenser ruthenus]|uniref:Putative sodium-coupled neutral amino acid transporter 6 n=1 Tax=Acipenser ruthenus TaxID=7906 RepID=A0A444UBH6_ACIRT|nr:putative sodium-coupled neutral amino acid transporter 6 [Acipenser ruthenus]
MGVCTAFHVVMGDLAVHLLQGLIGEEVTQNQRVLLIFAIGWLVVLPLSLTLTSDSILLSTTAVVGFTCFMVVVGSCGYVCFMDAVKGNILSNLPSSAMMEGVHVVLLISVVMSIPSIIQPCRQAIGTLLFEQQVNGTFSVKGDMSLCQHIATTSILLFLTMTAGILVQDVETVLGVVGTTTGAIICYIFPSLMQSKLRKGTVSGKVDHAARIYF